MSAIEQGQVTRDAADVYEEFYVPAFFQEWAERVADAARLRPGQRVLDVACGTGVLARAVARRIGEHAVVGHDLNDGMLAVARRRAPGIEWRQGRAEALPDPDGSFDVVVSQFGLMFFEDRRAAIAEMVRVLRPGGRLVVAVWDTLERTPAYAAVVDMLRRIVGERAADGLRTPYALGDTAALRALFADARLADVEIGSMEGTARFPSVRTWIATDVKGWTIADMVSDAQLDALLMEADRVLQPYVVPDGSVAFATPGHIVTATRV